MNNPSKWTKYALGTLFKSGDIYIVPIARAKSASPGDMYFEAPSLSKVKVAPQTKVIDPDGVVVGQVMNFIYDSISECLLGYIRLKEDRDYDLYTCQCEFSAEQWACLTCKQRFEKYETPCECLKNHSSLCELYQMQVKHVVLYPFLHDKEVSLQIRQRLLGEMMPSMLPHFEAGGDFEPK